MFCARTCVKKWTRNALNPLILQRLLKPLAAILLSRIQSLIAFVLPGVNRCNGKPANPRLFIRLRKMAAGWLLFHTKALQVPIFVVYVRCTYQSLNIFAKAHWTLLKMMKSIIPGVQGTRQGSRKAVSSGVSTVAWRAKWTCNSPTPVAQDNCCDPKQLLCSYSCALRNKTDRK